MSTHIHHVSTQLEKYFKEDRHICYVCRHSKLLNVQGGRLTKKVCRRRVDEDMKTRRHIWLVCRHITITVSTRQREVLTFHDCEYMQSRRIRSHVDVGESHVDVH